MWGSTSRSKRWRDASSPSRCFRPNVSTMGAPTRPRPAAAAAAGSRSCAAAGRGRRAESGSGSRVPMGASGRRVPTSNTNPACRLFPRPAARRGLPGPNSTPPQPGDIPAGMPSHRSQSRRTGTRGCACPQPRTGANNGNRSQGIHAARRARRRGVRLRAAGMGAGATLRRERRGVLLRAALGPALGVLGPEGEPGLRGHAAEGDRRGQRPARNSRTSWCSPAT